MPKHGFSDPYFPWFLYEYSGIFKAVLLFLFAANNQLISCHCFYLFQYCLRRQSSQKFYGIVFRKNNIFSYRITFLEHDLCQTLLGDSFYYIPLSTMYLVSISLCILWFKMTFLSATALFIF